MAIDKILGNIQSNPAITGALSGAAGGALVTAFTNKKSAKKMLKAGGLMAVGGLAWHAYQKYSSKSAPDVAPPAPVAAETPTSEAPVQLEQKQFDAVLNDEMPDNGVGLITSTMIAAAHADGQLTEEEQQRVWQHAISSGLPSDQLAMLAAELENPPSIEALVEQADSFEKRLEVYGAALLIIEEDCEAGAVFLQVLGSQLALPDALITVLHREAGQAEVA